LFGAACLTAALLFAREGLPPIPQLVLLTALAVFSANQRVVLPDGTFVSSSVMVYLAAVVVFATDGAALLGPILVGMAGALSVQNFRRKSWPWILFNSGLTAFAVLACAATYGAVTELLGSGLLSAFVAATVAAVAFVVVAWLVVAGSYTVESRHVPRELLRTLGMLVTEAVPFAVVGSFLGRLYLALGAAVLLLIIVPIVIAREMFASYMRVRETHEETVGMLIRALEAKDRYTSGHSERVANYARYMGEELNFMPARMERLRFAALMHDIGKLVVPNHLLNKPGKLTAEEFATVRIHEKVTVQMLSHIDFLQPIAAASHSDATKFDPDDDDHPIEPYIVMIADAYDAMTSTRSYRKALPQEVAFQELRDKAGVQFHPACVEALIGSIERRDEKHGAGYEQQDEFLDAPEAGLGSAGLGDLLPSEAGNG
jgi:hypothetical protein